VHRATHVESGEQWNASLAAATKDQANHPIGVRFLEWTKVKNSEGTMAAYVHFRTAPLFRQWLTAQGASPKRRLGAQALGPPLYRGG
jgi:hypothetical protein